MSTQKQQEIPAPATLPDKGLQDEKQLINIFFLAWKSYGLYPEDHTTSIKSFENLVAAFGNYFKNHGDLRLTVEKDHLLCRSEIIREVSPESPSEDIITLLYRDGIKWIEFKEGLNLEEITAFFRTAYKYRLFAEETEGDIVTALMDEELAYIDFKAVDVFWQDLLLMDFSQLPPPAHQPEEVAKQQETARSPQPAGSDGEDLYARSIADPLITPQLELSSDDYEILQQMIREEESWEITEDLFEVLLIILKSQTEQEKFTAVLDFISEEVVEAIARDKFVLLVELFQSLQKLFSPAALTEQDWKRPLINRFFQDLSRPEVFRLIADKLLELQPGEIEQLKALDQVLHYLSPEVIPFLVPVIMLRSSPEIQELVSQVIVHLSQRDIRPLEKIAQKHGMEMGEKLLAILSRLQGDRVSEILFRMCGHSSDKVRRKAIEELLDREPQNAPKLFSLIDDPSKTVRTSIFAAFAKHKSSAVENLLLNYLKENPSLKDPAHILACYEALGRCGSNLAVPFLRRTLLSRGWNSFMGAGKLISREGAAMALALLDTPQARIVLQKASRSRFKVIRKALERTKTITVLGENSDE